MPFLHQKTSTEKGNNTLPAALIQTPLKYLDWRVGIASIATVLIIWVISMLYTGWQCSVNFDTVCWSQRIVFWTVPGLTLLGVISTGLIVNRYLRHIADKERLANAFTQHYDNQDIAQVQTMIMEVASKIAGSLATAEVDTMSITNNSESNSTNVGASQETPKQQQEKKEEKQTLTTAKAILTELE